MSFPSGSSSSIWPDQDKKRVKIIIKKSLEKDPPKTIPSLYLKLIPRRSSSSSLPGARLLELDLRTTISTYTSNRHLKHHCLAFGPTSSVAPPRASTTSARPLITLISPSLPNSRLCSYSLQTLVFIVAESHERHSVSDNVEEVEDAKFVFTRTKIQHPLPRTVDWYDHLVFYAMGVTRTGLLMMNTQLLIYFQCFSR